MELQLYCPPEMSWLRDRTGEPPKGIDYFQDQLKLMLLLSRNKKDKEYLHVGLP